MKKSSLGKDIIEGLQEAIEYEKGNKTKAKVTKMKATKISIDTHFKADSSGMLLGKCSKCTNLFIETFSELYAEYKYCPICGSEFEKQ